MPVTEEWDKRAISLASEGHLWRVKKRVPLVPAICTPAKWVNYLIAQDHDLKMASKVWGQHPGYGVLKQV